MDVRRRRQVPERLRNAWLGWSLPLPNVHIKPLNEMIEDEPTGVEWLTPEQTERLISLMPHATNPTCGAPKDSSVAIL